MSSHYHRKTNESAMEKMLRVKLALTECVDNETTIYYGNLMQDVKRSIAKARKSHKKPVVTERMIIEARRIYEALTEVFSGNDKCIATCESHSK